MCYYIGCLQGRTEPKGQETVKTLNGMNSYIFNNTRVPKNKIKEVQIKV